MIRFIGDIHGEENRYLHLLKGVDKSIQVGDFGYGFNKWWDKEMLDWAKDNPQHRFIRGNHDDPAVCNSIPNYVGDWKIEGDIMYVGGAWSIDYGLRREGKSWWQDEELSSEEWDVVEKAYLDNKPKVMITHDCPFQIPKYMGLLDKEDLEVPSRTAVRLGRMFIRHQPEFWFFGHWHLTVSKEKDGCLFYCIGINDFVDFDEGERKLVKKSLL